MWRLLEAYSRTLTISHLTRLHYHIALNQTGKNFTVSHIA
jgi:hypothetical protein